VGQHDVSYIARKSASCDSTPQHQYRDRIAAHSPHHVDETCMKYRNVLEADEEDECSDQCQVQSQYFVEFSCSVLFVMIPAVFSKCLFVRVP